MLAYLNTKKKKILNGENTTICTPRRCGKTYTILECIKILKEKGKKTLLLSKKDFRYHKNSYKNDREFTRLHYVAKNEKEFNYLLKCTIFDVIFIDDFHLFDEKDIPLFCKCQIIKTMVPDFSKMDGKDMFWL